MTRTTEHEAWIFRRLSELPQFSSFIPGAADLVYQSGVEYFNALFGGRETALSHLGLWIATRPSGFSCNHINLLLANGSICGLTLELEGRAIAALQKSDLLFLLRTVKQEGRDLLREKSELIRAMTPAIREDEYYLRSLAVRESYRGKGLGAVLLKHFISNGIALGFLRFRLDVRSDNLAAIDLYRKLGFRISAQFLVPGTSWKLYSMVLERGGT